MLISNSCSSIFFSTVSSEGAELLSASARGGAGLSSAAPTEGEDEGEVSIGATGFSAGPIGSIGATGFSISRNLASIVSSLILFVLGSEVLLNFSKIGFSTLSLTSIAPNSAFKSSKLVLSLFNFSSETFCTGLFSSSNFLSSIFGRATLVFSGFIEATGLFDNTLVFRVSNGFSTTKFDLRLSFFRPFLSFVLSLIAKAARALLIKLLVLPSLAYNAYCLPPLSSPRT